MGSRVSAESWRLLLRSETQGWGGLSRTTMAWWPRGGLSSMITSLSGDGVLILSIPPVWSLLLLFTLLGVEEEDPCCWDLGEKNDVMVDSVPSLPPPFSLPLAPPPLLLLWVVFALGDIDVVHSYKAAGGSLQSQPLSH